MAQGVVEGKTLAIRWLLEASRKRPNSSDLKLIYYNSSKYEKRNITIFSNQIDYN
jgi:hypothetical protein